MARKDVEVGEKAWLEAFNGGDAAAVVATYAESGRLMPPGSDILEGHAAIEAFVKGFIATGAKLSFDLVDVHDAGDLCASIGVYRMTIPGDDGPQEDRGKFVEIWKRQPDGAWLIVDDIFNSSTAPPG